MTSDESTVDTTRPFRSVKEAVALFCEHLLSGEAFSQRSSTSIKPPPPKPIYSPSTTPKPDQYDISSPSYSTTSSRFNQGRGDDLIILNSLKKLEAELAETKREVVLLKERGSEIDVAVASLNAELHKNKARLAEMEAMGMRMAAKSTVFIKEHHLKVASDRWSDEEEIADKFEYLPSLATALRLGEADGEASGRRRVRVTKKKKKRKPIVPLIGDLFSKKKDPRDQDEEDLYSKPNYFRVVT